MAAPRTWPSREGFTADVLGKVLQNTLLTPWTTTPLVLLARYTAEGTQLAEQHPRLFWFLQALASLAVLRRLNAWLNTRALNNGVSDRFHWHREVVVLTGGSNGIGRQVAELLGARGIKVAILDIQPPESQPLAPTVRFYECDISSPSAIAAAAADIRSSLGEPTILINNAGICSGKTILGSTEAQTRLHFEVNTLAHYWLAREFLPAMVTRNHGMVVTVASQAGYVTTPNLVDYAATKSAAISFHEGLAAELVARYRAPCVRTVLLTPGSTRTTLIGRLTPEDTWFNPLLRPETVAEALVAQILSGSSGHVLVPGSTGCFARVLRGFPPWMQHLLRVRLERLMRAD
ncbi:short chain dehydrogenase/reductase family protein [Aspergillus clavatus NRRL 1]|uniref:Short-chain dehydrogenase/reductase 3 n=1 Tax=Aspergillus clavatus (strain ATCC 1007 / CBS 513.65 / DSM 816 / NCTC 3887 / NRRL 1 / QM 1276 / 107) TaxID=344612 RepID=A1CSM2_ASPCL|nr:short chain dehydrogenase/reductase family protein [Aspergillus clavatus NRRL 1]EAW06309.1 short chain dehydrogenase/reductase family protein [Aspergillus clavatus NRRL 1]